MGSGFTKQQTIEFVCCACMQAVFYHKASKTLLVTDAVVYISSDPPEVLLPA